MPRIVDPRLPATLRALREQAGLSLRDLAKRAYSSRSHLHDIEQGRKSPPPDLMVRLDEALGAGGHLAGMVRDDPAGLSGEEQQRLRAAITRPRRIDAGTIDSLAAVLAHQRRLEDVVGSAAVVRPVLAQLSAIEQLVNGARRDKHWPRLVDVAGQWAQFGGWLSAATGDHASSRAWYLRAMEWATEAGNPHLTATSLSMRGHLAWMRGETAAMVELSRAAAWQPASPGVRGVAVQQEARGLAILGDAEGADRQLDNAQELTARAADARDREPDWLYFHDPTYLMMQRGLAQRYLRRYDRAVELLQSGLDQLPGEVRRSDWVGWYVCQLAATHVAAGDRDVAASWIAEAREIADSTGAKRLAGEVAQVEREIDC
ncbi:helix-turn-helix transcriptional regulator [Solwaraspora sp. WMMA2065]|uniref:helix-turn-helix domain-containing protein n=1 Tax=Solwaraspora sp. WMMA2065 TaxID=3015166 RepID=UPI00259BB66A|nr:helix-turn-helix transcriptional regulator [Solwaraspora sp. WMMA2065]WJK37624.1 helix-turn-helix transcriptional regulator [Solwaraspora sp. WMMA2065]